jgi:hypothetical protein
MPNMKQLATAALIPLAGVVALGCGSPVATNRPKATSPPTMATTTTSTSPPPPTTATTAPPNDSPTSGGGPCTSGQLSATVGSGQGAAGTEIYRLVFTNVGSASCTLQGYPGVSFVGANGVQLGSPAIRRGSTTPPLTSLEPKQSVYATFTYPGSGNICGNGGTPTAGLRVYPPNQTAALFAPYTDASVCPTAAGAGSGMTIYPIGVQGEP